MPKSHGYDSKPMIARRREMGRRIRSARKKAGLKTQTDLAVLIGVATAPKRRADAIASPSASGLRFVAGGLYPKKE